MIKKFLIVFFVLSCGIAAAQTNLPKYRWGKLSTEYGDIERLCKGNIQPALLLADFSKGNKSDIVIAEKTEGPSVVLYRYQEEKKWQSYLIEKRATEVGEAIIDGDVDGDGDLDLLIGSDEGKEIWWWENPYHDFDHDKPWKRNYLKRSGSLGHRDLAFGDFDNDRNPELAFWSENSLWVAKRKENASRADEWTLSAIYSYNTVCQMEQKTSGSELEVNGINHHEGIAIADVDLDGKTDLLAGGMWFKYQDQKYVAHSIDQGYIGGRIAAGQIVQGGWPEIVMAPGDGIGPIVMYQLENGVWKQNLLLKTARRVGSIQIIDFNKDGFVDIVGGEMRTANVTDSKVFILFNDGKNNFVKMDVESGKCAHGLIAGDIDGDGDNDLVGKPYAFGAPRLDIWINNGEK